MSNPETGLQSLDDYPAARGGNVPLHVLEQSRAGVVHDLGNLIQVALSGLSHVARNPSVSAVPDLEPVIASARAALQSAGTLVSETIGSTRERHREDDSTDVGACLAGIEALIPAGWKPGIRLEVRAASDLHSAGCDRLGLQNAILNLLFNARDAMPDGGLISVDATTSDRDFAAWIELRVTDNGIGMTEKTVNRAFDPFFTTKGTGLGGVGLPMVKQFAREHGGSVEIESTFGAGTTVILRLPAKAPPIDGR